MQRCIFFDKDGTLLRFDEMWIPVARNAVRRILKELMKSEILANELLEAIGVYEDHGDIEGVLCHGTYRMISDCFQKCFAQKGILLDHEEMYRMTKEAFHSSLDTGRILPVCDDLPGVLSRLKEQNCLLVLVTSDDSVVTGECLKALGIEGLFDCVYTHEDGGAAKPDPYYINITLEKNQIPRERAYMVGDTVSDMCFARNAGVTAIGIANHENDIKTLSRYTDYIISDVSQVQDMIHE